MTAFDLKNGEMMSVCVPKNCLDCDSMTQIKHENGLPIDIDTGKLLDGFSVFADYSYSNSYVHYTIQKNV